MIKRLSSYPIALRFVFFFQAEVGIRDTSVTGVQTCALPISSVAVAPGAIRRRDATDGHHSNAAPAPSPASARPQVGTSPRSEERRVGKQWRFAWSTPQRQKLKFVTLKRYNLPLNPLHIHHES